MKYQEARIVFVGDEHVGKSTLINGIISYNFTEEVMHVFPVVTIPASATSYNIVLHIVDTGVDEEHQKDLEVEIKRADVLVMIYSVESVDSIAHIHDIWLPKAQRLLGDRSKGVPVLLVGNKADVKAAVATAQLERQEDIAKKIMRDFQEVEVWVDCSAKTMMNTNDLLFYAQKSAVCPLRAIFDSSRGQLTEACKKALERIFKLCDKDVDGVLNDAELNTFQEVCYGGSLQPHELESVKNMVRGRCPQGVVPEGLNLLGFQFLQTIFIHDSKPEMPWTVLRKFGYGLDLELTEEYLNPVVHVAPEQSAELSNTGIQFFTTLFHRYDTDRDSALSPSELDNLFSTTKGIPWSKTFTEDTITDFNGNVILRGFLALWNMTTQIDHSITLSYLSQLGCEAPKEALRFIYKSASGAKANASPGVSTVLLCYVFGAGAVGKTSLLKSFIEKPFYDVHVPSDAPYSVANTVSVPPSGRSRVSQPGHASPAGSEKYLVMLEVPPTVESPLDSKENMAKCDVVLLLYDNGQPGSSTYIQPIFHRLQTEFPSIPCIVARTKADLPEFKTSQNSFTSKNKQVVHTTISTKTAHPSKLFEDLVVLAVGQQEKNMAGGLALWKRRVGFGITITVVVGGLVFAGRLLWKAWKK